MKREEGLHGLTQMASRNGVCVQQQLKENRKSSGRKKQDNPSPHSSFSHIEMTMRESESHRKENYYRWLKAGFGVGSRQMQKDFIGEPPFTGLKGRKKKWGCIPPKGAVCSQWKGEKSLTTKRHTLPSFTTMLLFPENKLIFEPSRISTTN